MSEQDKQGQAEHEDDSKATDSMSDDTSNTDEAEFDDSDLEGEENDSVLDLEDGKSSKNKEKATIADEQRQKQISTWEERYNNGDVEFDKIPGWIQREIKLKEKEPDIDDLLEKKLAEKEDGRLYEERKKQLTSVKMTANQKNKLVARYKQLSGRLPKGEALELAIEAAGISIAERKERPKSMAVPKGSNKAPDAGISDDMTWKEAQKTYSEDERRKYLLKQLQ